jgi:hypothetical protein
MRLTRLQELYARALAQRGKPATACVSPEDLLALVRREGPEEHRLSVLDHVMSCNQCHREFDLLRALEAAGAGTGRASAISITRRLTPWALAASLLLVVGVGLVLRDRAQSGDIVRGGSHGLVLLAPPSEVPAGRPITFIWQSVGGAQRYRLEILGPDGAMVFSQLTADTSVILSGDHLRPGSSYQWWVRDASPGAQLASTLRPLRVRSQ